MIRTRYVTLVFVLLIVCSCSAQDIASFNLSLPQSPETVDEIIPDTGLMGQDTRFDLSPGGKYAGESDIGIVVHTIAGAAEIKVDEACTLRWYDEKLLVCGGHFIYFESPQDFLELPVYLVQAQSIDLDRILSEAMTIYWYQGLNMLALHHFDVNQQSSSMLIIRNIEQIEKILEEYPHTLLPVIPPADGYDNVEVVVPRKDLRDQGAWTMSLQEDKLVYQASPNIEENHPLYVRPGTQLASPNKKYILSLNETATHLSIMTADNKNTVAELNLLEDYPRGYTFQVAGWDIDSSGVYFRTAVNPGLTPLSPPYYHHSAIRKLNVP